MSVTRPMSDVSSTYVAKGTNGQSEWTLLMDTNSCDFWIKQKIPTIGISPASNIPVNNMNISNNLFDKLQIKVFTVEQIPPTLPESVEGVLGICQSPLPTSFLETTKTTSNNRAILLEPTASGFLRVVVGSQALAETILWKTIKWITVAPELTWWKSKLSALKISNNESGSWSESLDLVVDSTVTMVKMPRPMADKINLALGFKRLPGVAVYEGECLQDFPTFTLMFADGTEIPFPSSLLIYRNNKRCYSAIADHSANTIVLGSNFLRGWKTLFDVDNHRIGLQLLEKPVTPIEQPVPVNPVPTDDGNKDILSNKVFIIALSTGLVAAAILAICLLIFIMKKRKRQRNDAEQSRETINNAEHGIQDKHDNDDFSSITTSLSSNSQYSQQQAFYESYDASLHSSFEGSIKK